MLLNRPGTSIRVLVESTKNLPPDERVYVEMDVMDRGTHMWLQGLGDAGLTSFELSRRAIGKMFKKIEGLKMRPENEPFELERDADGYLTNKCAEALAPLHTEFVDMIMKSGTLTPQERKNSLSRSQ